MNLISQLRGKRKLHEGGELMVIGWERIGETLGVSASTCQRHRKQLFEAGVITLFPRRILDKRNRGQVYMASQGSIRKYCADRAVKGETVL
jgi:DNA-binding Lrp family transcriptional regulator